MSFEEEHSRPKDVFDLLPDALVLEIFNKLQDAKSLSICMSLCKRFVSLVPQTDDVHLTLSHRNILPEATAKPGSHTNSLHGFVNRVVFKPIQSFMRRMVTKKSTTCSHCDNNDDDNDDFPLSLPNDMLKSFKQIRSLIVQLPTQNGDVSSGSGSGSLLKWTAEFGKELESCAILGASRFRKREAQNEGNVTSENREQDHDQNRRNLTNKKLKKRIVWTISCLIACSARHHMLKQIISLNPMIRGLEIGDGSKQGLIRMKDRQLMELKEEMGSTGVVVERTIVPAVTVKMWYVPVMELPESGYVMKGATLAVIRPVVEEKRPSLAAAAEKDDVCLAVGAFGNGGEEGEKCFGEAVRKLIMKKPAYTLEMNSF